jgi:hypothetical protein
MAVTVTKYGNDLAHIGRTPRWLNFLVAGERLTQGAETAVLRSLPIGTIMIDANIVCSVEATEAGAGTDTLDLVLALVGGDQVVFTGTSDNGGAVDVMDRSVNLLGSNFPVAEEVDLEILRTVATETITAAATYRVGVLLCRPMADR